MALDFSKLGASDPVNTVVHPRELFAALPNKAHRFAYPRDVQSEVWAQWFDRRADRDLVIKMNTGSGKTIVGLLILKSCLNEHLGPAVYVAPDRYLANQVATEAAALGLTIAHDPHDPLFTTGKAILVVNIFKMINGRSVFGTRDTGIKIPVGSVVIDDAHACLNTTENQFSLSIPQTAPLYSKLLSLFETDLSRQSASGFLDIKAGDPVTRLVLPFWAWRRRLTEATTLLHESKETDELRFSWALVKDALSQAYVVFSSGRIEISTRVIPIDVIPSFDAAKRRIFLTATLADDSVLLTTFAVSAEAAQQPVTPAAASDLGERLILAPFALNPQLSEDAFKSVVTEVSKEVNVSVIVPSRQRAEHWADVAHRVLDGTSLESGIAQLKSGHVGLTVVVNRYDGIDLPGDACRMLVLDGMPTARRLLDQVDDSVLYGTDELLAQRVQRIEQGMGRAIRSADDWCVVLLAGRSLTDHLFNQRALDKLTPGTLAQLRLSEQLGDQLRGKPAHEILAAIRSVLNRDPGWVRASKAALVGVRYDRSGQVNAVAVAQRAAFDAIRSGNTQKAIDVLQGAVNAIGDRRTRGWMKEQLARSVDLVNEVEAQQILLSAATDNNLVIKPLEGIGYTRLTPTAKKQGAIILDELTRNGATANAWLLRIEGILENLQFVEDAAPRFELALKEFFEALGLRAQRPDKELGVGPDVLASLGNLVFAVIECKNGAVTDRISKADANQLSGSVQWFRQTYDSTCTPLPMIVHPSSVFDAIAAPPDNTRVIDRNKLLSIHDGLRTFARAIAAGPWPPTEAVLATQLEAAALTGQAFPHKYTTAGKRG